MDDRAIIFNLKEAGRVGPRTMLALLDYFGSFEEVWEAGETALLEIPRIGRKTVKRIIDGRKKWEETESQLAYWEEQDIRIITLVDADYPQRLRRLGDPPSLLYVRGNLDFGGRPLVAVVGTHEADAEGVLTAENWGEKIAGRGGVVVSGLARGIDAAAHVGTLQAAGITVAVLGSGFANVYPPEHHSLAGQIAETGVVVSEYSPPTQVSVGRLMARNRIVVGLSDAVLVIQVHESSTGTMDAAACSEEQGKPLFVIGRDRIPQLGQLKACGAIVLEENHDVDLVLNYL